MVVCEGVSGDFEIVLDSGVGRIERKTIMSCRLSMVLDDAQILPLGRLRSNDECRVHQAAPPVLSCHCSADIPDRSFRSNSALDRQTCCRHHVSIENHFARRVDHWHAY